MKYLLVIQHSNGQYGQSPLKLSYIYIYVYIYIHMIFIMLIVQYFQNIYLLLSIWVITIKIDSNKLIPSGKQT